MEETRIQYLDKEREAMDYIADRFDETFDQVHVYFHLRNEMGSLAVRHLADGTSVESAKALDIGCGTGNFIDHLLRLGFRDVAGIDVSPKAIAIAKEKFPGLELHVGPIEETPFESGSYDLIAASRSVHHFQDHPKLARKVLELLKPGGIFVFSEPVESHSLNRHPWFGRSLRILGLPLLLFLRIKNADIWRRNRRFNADNAVQPEHHHGVVPAALFECLEMQGFERVFTKQYHIVTNIFGYFLSWESPLDRFIGGCIRILDVPFEALFDPAEVNGVFRKPTGRT